MLFIEVIYKFQVARDKPMNLWTISMIIDQCFHEFMILCLRCSQTPRTQRKNFYNKKKLKKKR